MMQTVLSVTILSLQPGPGLFYHSYEPQRKPNLANDDFSLLSLACLCFPALAESLFNGLGLGTVVGLGLGALLLLLVVVDVSCFFLRHCGLLMCITRTLCSKKTATSGKGKDMEEGKAAYL